MWGCVQAAGLDWAGPGSDRGVSTAVQLPPRLSSQKYQNEFNTNVAMAEIYKYAKRYRPQVSSPRREARGTPRPTSALPSRSWKPGSAGLRYSGPQDSGLCCGRGCQHRESRPRVRVRVCACVCAPRRCVVGPGGGVLGPELNPLPTTRPPPPQIVSALEANPTARRTQLQHKFEQVVALMEDNIYECYSEA